ncbi:MAG: transcription-repair coupling factor [Pirellulales bacterium]
MALSDVLPSAPSRLFELVDRLDGVEGFAGVVASLQAGHASTLDGAWGSSRALAAAALLRRASAPLVIVCPHADDVDSMVDDLHLFTDERATPFPAWELDAAELRRDEVYGQRLRVLKQLAEPDPPRLLATSIQALLQPVPARDELARHTRLIRVGQSLELEALLRWLAENRFQNMPAVELPGEFALHGGILDLFAPDWDHPLRIELFDDQVESLRRFDIATQRSLANLDEVQLTVLDAAAEYREQFVAHVPPGTWFFLVEPAELDDAGRHWIDRQEHPERFHAAADVLKAIYQHPSVTAEAIAPTSLETTCRLRVESVERFSGDINQVRSELEAIAGDHEVHVVCQTEAEAQRLAEIFLTTALAASGRLHFPVGRLAAGFRLVPARTLVLSANELFHRAEVDRSSKRHLSRVIDSFLDLRENDLVVHVGHGIARYLGLRLLEKEGQSEEHLELEFQGGTKLFVPVSRIELVQKYVGGSKARPTLARLGGRSWLRHKQMAEAAVEDLAVDMLNLQARRSVRPGIAFPPDTEWQHEFDASFPYEETPDQLEAIAAIKREMQLPRPLDRLICGDVGYGKTEVAMRAAFKAIEAGYQVAVLVPTTVLCEQHRRTFTARMAQFPFTIASLSRFLTGKEQQQVLSALETGGIDIVIGTHRLAQHDVRFQNLGLVIIDEEQRFGVEVKERLKALRETVDVLTLTATPIPRTLHMSLLGLRDISNLVTPPEERLAVETRVTRFDEELIRTAVLRELNREGQIFFVHNRIYDIEALATSLRRIVPEARLRIGHGQMPEGQLEEVMFDFVNHRFDLLLATTIVESGLDIPNANTIFIDQADKYGLADLHQLRGRVGRYKHRAYCYLLVDPHQTLNPTAAKRLRAIEEFSDIGAGFAIAMRDLEIRGAGNILGTQQSGHIAAVGYELYCELLEKAVRRHKKLPQTEQIEVHVNLPGQAFLPRSYVPNLRAKIDVYRRLARSSALSSLADLRNELVDRFGPLPAPAARLLAVQEVRVLAHGWQIDTLRIEDGYLVFEYASRPKIERLAARLRGRLRVVDRQSAYLPLTGELSSPDLLLATAKEVLQPDPAPH